MTIITEGKNWDSMSDKAKDLVLHADRDLELKNHRRTVKANLNKKKSEGNYDGDDALGLWKHHVDKAAISCCDQNGDGEKVWHKMFPSNVRGEAAKYLESLHKDSLHEGVNELPEEEIDLDKINFYGMLDNVLNKNIISFKEKFNELFINRLYEAVENFKSNLADHVFNGKIEEISSSLLGNYIKKAKNSAMNSRASASVLFAANVNRNNPNRDPSSVWIQHYDDAVKRSDNIDLAADKLVRKSMKPAPNLNAENLEESNFSRLVKKLEGKGLPAKEAGGIAYNQGKKKYGKKGMADKARRGKEEHED